MIAGELPMAELATRMSEYQVDKYYFLKGKEFVVRNGSAMPRLWLGKLIRGFVPVPWKPGWGSYAVSLFRWLLYLAALLGIWRAWKQTDTSYRDALAAMFWTTAATVLLFWGCARFSFPLDAMLLPFAALAAADIGKVTRTATPR